MIDRDYQQRRGIIAQCFKPDENLTEQRVARYIDSTKIDGFWLDNVCLKALASSLECMIRVYFGDKIFDGDVFLQGLLQPLQFQKNGDENGEKVLEIILIGNNHYGSFKQKQIEVPDPLPQKHF